MIFQKESIKNIDMVDTMLHRSIALERNFRNICLLFSKMYALEHCLLTRCQKRCWFKKECLQILMFKKEFTGTLLLQKNLYMNIAVAERTYI